jgi:uncharacterized membrane protein
LFFSSEDGILHLFRLHGLDDAIRQGVIYPRLFPDFAFGYGHAVLSYYGPLSYYIAEGAHLAGANYSDAIKLAFALSFLGSAFAAYWLARRFVAPLPALVGATAYVYFPYHFVLAYERGALAEHIAWIFLPLILWGLTPQFNVQPAVCLLGEKSKRFALLISALSVAALLLTHSLVTMIFMPFAVIYGWLINGESSLRERAARLSLAIGTGLGLSAFQWLPIVAQSRWVHLSAAPGGELYVQRFASAYNFIQETLLFEYVRGLVIPTTRWRSSISCCCWPPASHWGIAGCARCTGACRSAYSPC